LIFGTPRNKYSLLFFVPEIYGSGKSEQLLGSFLREYNSSGQEEKHPVIIASKFFPSPWRLTHSSFNNALEATLQRLGVNCVDLYQIHSPALTLRSVEVWAEALVGAVKSGKVKAVGVSNYNAEKLRRTHAVLAKHGIPLATNQIEFSLLRNNPLMNGLISTCKELNVTVIAYSPLGMGRLTGKYTKENPPQGRRLFGQIPLEELEVLVGKLKEIGAKHEKSPAQVALNWCICHGTIPIAGVKNERQAEENLQAINWRLSEQEVQELDKLSRPSSSLFGSLFQD